ncbi:hypothetical protein E8E12_004202 [Didymella heteroderae]|uniref:AAA+ ATPase domain-containing protein n=1 Tax=Didymella heteroderae TaxID=1769908 RepID=A0A9P4WNP7_9PLEO|nr:hypothetical protein E8E12_004202 [Didymella heteroderae]
MADNAVSTQISELKAQLEALEATLGSSKRVGNNAQSTHVTKGGDVVQPTAISKVKFGEDGPDNVESPNTDSTTSKEVDTALAELLKSSGSADEPKPTPPEIIPQLNLVNWTQFKNAVLDEPKRYAIDVLVGPAKFYWQKRREELNLQRGASEDFSVPVPTQLATLHKPGKPPIVYEHAQGQFDMPERIRINCGKLLAILGDITESSLGTESLVMLRPYKLLVRYDDAIRQRLQALEEQEFSNGAVPQQHQQTDDDLEARAEHDTKDDQSIVPDPPVGDKPQRTEIESLRCLVKFMDTEISPDQFRSRNLQKIGFRNLWYAYRPGDLVVSWGDLDDKRSSELTGSTEQSKTSGQASAKGPPSIWRVLSVSKGRPVLGYPHGVEGSDRSRPPTSKINKLSILCYMIAYDGTSYGPLGHAFEISPFEGMKYFRDLDPCPARYVADYDSIEARLVDRGKRFIQYTSPSHCLYDGLTLSKHPCGLPCKVNSIHGVKKDVKAELVDGHVIVDFKEAQREDSGWAIKHQIPEASGGSGLETTEDYPRSIWKDNTLKVLEKAEPENIFEDDHLDAADMEDFVASNQFLAAYKDSSGEDHIDHRAFEPIDFALLPDRVVGFDLHRRKFSILALDYLHPVQVKKEGWADLKLPRGHKHMVQAQIKTHFLEKRARQTRVLQGADADLVRGKGLGLIILLHGAPGVGKTSTAECVAESLRKPLYPITCGDLGVTAPAVEDMLNSTFAKAETWDCVLLLDEADVFLAQRTRTDLKRNAIVSVFLRVLEYYKGILILTTNRVGAFDEAFKSRIHLHLYYPALNKDQTLAIWKMNLDRVIDRKQGRITADEGEILRFAEAHFEQHKKSNTRWNGRQIRNAFQTALAMAEYEALEAAGLEEAWDESAELLDTEAQLKVAHFETVAEASMQFDSHPIDRYPGNSVYIPQLPLKLSISIDSPGQPHLLKSKCPGNGTQNDCSFQHR